MSKSLGNTYTLDQLLEKGIEPLSYRLFCYTAHYRTKLNFTWDAIKSAQTALNRLREATRQQKNGTEKADQNKIKEYEERFLNAINDNLNTPLALGILFSMVKSEEKSRDVYDLAIAFRHIVE